MLGPVIVGVVIVLIATVLAARAARADSSRKTREAVDVARGEAAALVKAAELQAAARKTHLATQARTGALGMRTAQDQAIARGEASVERRAAAVARGEAELAERLDLLDQREEQLDADQREVQSRRDRAS